MNELAMTRPVRVSARTNRRVESFLINKTGAIIGYSSIALLATIGWLLRDQQLIHAKDGVGYWLGIIGGSLMLVLLLYPLRKRLRIFRRFGATRYWFRMHMILGLVGPLLILFHCNFQLGSFNSRVAFWSMLLVAGSGIIGRYFYARIHRGLYGRKTSLRELQGDLTASVEKRYGLATLMPTLVARLDSLSSELQGNQITQSLGAGRSLKWSFTHHLMFLSLRLTARRELKAAAAESAVIQRDYKRLRRTAGRYIKVYTSAMGRVAQFSFYERLFALWHVFHLPIFFMMVLTAFMHILAVHMY